MNHKTIRSHIFRLALVAAAAAIQAPMQSLADTYQWSGTININGTREITNNDMYLVESASSSQMSSFLVSAPNKDFWVYALIPNYPNLPDYHLVYKAYIYRYTPDRPSWLANQIDTWAAPVTFAPSGTSTLPGILRLRNYNNTLSVMSSDVFDADGKRRIDTNNINWAILDFEGIYTANPFIQVDGVHASLLESTLDLEHMIFRGSKNIHTNNGGVGGLIRSNLGAARTLNIKGDVGFVNNFGNNGGVLFGNSSVVFEGNVFFDGNIGGIVGASSALRDENGLFTDQELQDPEGFELPAVTFTKNDAAAGSIRLNASNVSLTFKQTALFTNNVSGGEAGNILLGGGSSGNYRLVFDGNAAFYGNIAGFIGKVGGTVGGAGPGRGGAICFLLTTSVPSSALFNQEAIFISNRASDGGGAISSVQVAGSNVSFTFQGRAIFTDNIGGRENRFEHVDAVLTEELIPYLGQLAPLPNYNGNGGAIASLGNNEQAAVLTFNAEAEFARNRSLGLGGAISHRGSNGLIIFNANSTLTDNATGTLERLYTTNPIGVIGAVASNGGAIASSVKTYFGGDAGGQLVAEGNVAYFRASGTIDGMPVITGGNGGAIYSDGNAGGLYIDQEYRFAGNQAGGNGGAIVAIGLSSGTAYAGAERNYALEITKAGLFIDNLASGTNKGGAIYARSALVSSGAVFENNAAGGEGGAIHMIATSSTVGARLVLNAETDDIIFTGNRSGVTTDESAVDLTLVTSQTSTGGKIAYDANSGSKNDIHFDMLGVSGSTATVIGTATYWSFAYEDVVNLSSTLALNAAAGRKIYFDGGITQTNKESTNGRLTVDITGAGTVEFDNASADIHGITTVQSGTLRLRNGTYGHSGNDTATTFTLLSNATLEANGAVQAETITIGSGATLRVLDGGSLRFNSANAISYQGAVNLGGSGTIFTGAPAAITAQSINVGDAGHTQRQTLTLLNASNQGLNVTLNASHLSFGLFSGGADHAKVGSLDLGSTKNTIHLTSLASGNFTLITADSNIANNTTAFDIYYKGAILPTNNRLSATASVSGQNLLLNYNATNAVVTWTGASGDNWSATDAKWTGAGVTDGKFLYGDVVKFDATKNGNVAVNADTAAAGMTISNNYTFTGMGGIELNKLLWSGAANAEANGVLVKDGAANTTLTLANATGTGAANQFAGIDIKAGTVEAGNAAQLGTALSNITFSGSATDNATLKVSGTMLLSGENGNQRLNIGADKAANIVVDSAGVLVVADNRANSANGGVLHLDSNSTLNLTANGDVMFSGNMAASGGAAYLESGATLNVDVADGKTVLFGNPNREAALLDPRLLHADTLASTDTSAVINKNGLGALLLNGDNSAYAGQLNINSGTVWMNSNATLGGNVTLNNAGSLFAASTVTGSLTANANTFIQVGDAASFIPQVMRVGGAFAMDNATLVLDGFQGSLIYRDIYTDTVETDSLHLTGTNNLDVNFAALSSGLYRILTITSGSNQFLDENGDFTIPTSLAMTSVSSSTITVTATNPNTNQLETLYLVNSNTTFRRNVDDLVLTSGGESILGKRFNGDVVIDGQIRSFDTTVYDSEGTAISGTVWISGSYIGSGTESMAIDSGAGHTVEERGNSLMLDVQVQNIRSLWTGSAAAAWNAADPNWLDPIGNADTRFVAGDGVHFDSISDAGYEENRTIAVYGGGVVVGEMIVSGTGNYTFTGGPISGESFRSNLENPTRATGALEMNGTGVLVLANAGNRFGGGFFINSGTVIGNTTSLNENTIHLAENATVIYAQEHTDTMIGTISGEGTFAKVGSGTLTLGTINQVTVGNAFLEGGQVIVTASNALRAAGVLGIGPEASLVFSTTLTAGALVHSGTLQRTASPVSNTVGIMSLVGDYIASPGSKIVLNILQEGMGLDSLVVDGNAAGTSEIVLNISGTYTRTSRPDAKRDVSLISATGVNAIQITNPLAVSFYDSGTAGIGTEYSFVQGRNGTIFLRNHDAVPADANLPMIGASPIVSDMLGQAINNAVTERINARHEHVAKGIMAWTNYARTDDHVRDGFYHDTDLRSDIFQLGAEYVLSDPDQTRFGQLTLGLSYAYASGKATRDNESTIDAESHAINAYAAWRKGVFYANAIVGYTPVSDFEATTTDELDSDGTVDGDRLTASLELGGIFEIERGGQLEPYIHALWQQNSFDQISRPTHDYSFNDPTSPNGRGYSFSDFSTLRSLAGIRWSFRYDPTEKFALKPWIGAGFGYASDDSYDIIVGRQSVEKDLAGEYYKFSGGFSAAWAFGLETYISCHWTKGAATSTLSLLGGINYRW